MVECVLCGLSTAHPLFDDEQRPFCCPACLEVDRLLREDAGAAPEQSTTQRTASQLGTTTVEVSGLWCASCAWLIEETLRRTPGVASADVSFAQRKAQVTFDAERTTPHRLLRRVKRLGYRAWLPDEEPHDEESAFLDRLLVSGVFAMHVMLISAIIYVRQWLGMASAETTWLTHIFNLMSLLGTIPVLLFLGIPIVRAGLASLVRRHPNLHTLIAIGASAAVVLSIRNLALGLDRVYFDTACMLLFLVSVGRWLEMRAQKAGLDALTAFQDRLPTDVTQLTPKGEEQVPVEAVPTGARVLVRPGERFPIDGIVAAGQGDVDESILTGEPTPVTRGPQDRVYAGTINVDGAFEVVVTATGDETISGQIGKLLHQALWQKAPVERLADRLAALMVPTAVGLAVGTFLFWTTRTGVEAGLLNALAVLLIACPCALGLATPLTMWLGVGRAAGAGIVLRSTAALERLAAVERVFFDKTGTLTQLPLAVTSVATDGIDSETFLARVAAVESRSEHPLAQAIVTAAQQNDGAQHIKALPPVSHVRVWPGRGISGRYNGTTLWIGSRRLMEAHDVATPDRLATTAERWQASGMSVIYAGWDERVVGLLGLGERIRPDATETITSLQGLGLSVEVLTGDDAAAGKRWATSLGVPVRAEQHPDEKMNRLEQTGKAAMVGDGINDGPALAAAAVGIALSDGTDIAQSAADVLLLNDDLRSVPWLVRLSRRAMALTRQNLIWAFAYNIIGLTLAMTGYLQPVLAALAMVISSLIVTRNAMRLQKPIA